MRWLLVPTPAVAGILSFVLSWPDEDFRSSGLLAGVALSILLAGVLLATRRPWRGRAAPVALAARGGVSFVLLVGLVGLAGGVPELLRERFGLLLSADDRGLLAVAAFDGGFVAVGHPETGAAWTSLDGLTWTQVDLPPSHVGLELRAMAPTDGTLWVVAEDGAADGLLAEVPGLEQDWVAGSRFIHERQGQQPRGAAGFGGQLLTFGSTYGNDVIFFRGDPRETLVQASPEPAADRGYSARDLACGDDACVAVGEHWEPAAAFWHTSDGDDWELVDFDGDAATATGVAVVADGWLAVGHDDEGTAVAWRSGDGRAWEPDPALSLTGAAFEGVAVDEDAVMAYGYSTSSDQPDVWTFDGERWVANAFDAPAGSRIRALAVSGETVVAAGVEGDDLRAAVWVSTAGSPFRPIVLEMPGS